MLISEKGMYRARYHGKKQLSHSAVLAVKKVEDFPCYAMTKQANYWLKNVANKNENTTRGMPSTT